MLKYRIISGVSFLSLVAAMAVWAPTAVIAVFILLLTALAVLETVKLLEAAEYPVLKWTALGLGLLWVLLAGLSESGGTVYGILYRAFPAVAVWVITLGCLFRSDQSRSLSKMTGTFASVAYVPGLIQFLMLLLYTGQGSVHQDGRMLLLFGILVIKFTDIGAYFTGCAIGKHKLIPKISPAKTWEGVIGGVAVAVAMSLLFLLLVGFEISGIRFRLWDGIVLGILLSVAGILGDLVESMLKRSADMKDSGSWIRGMGGLLDVLDSLLFAFPLLYLYVRWMHLR